MNLSGFLHILNVSLVCDTWRYWQEIWNLLCMEKIRQGWIKVLTSSQLHLQPNIFAHVESKGGQNV
jgi:hypothetical protein